MGWLTSLASLSKILHGIELVWNKTVDFLEDSRLIELGELRAQHEQDIQSSIKKKRANDKRRAAIKRVRDNREKNSDG